MTFYKSVPGVIDATIAALLAWPTVIPVSKSASKFCQKEENLLHQ